MPSPQAQTVAIPKRWPLYGGLQTRTSVLPLTQGARLLNGYVEYDPDTQEYWVYKRPGLGSTAVIDGTGTSQGKTGLGLYTFSGFNLPFFQNITFGVFGSTSTGGTVYGVKPGGAQFTIGTVGFSLGLNGAPFAFFETVNSVTLGQPTVVIGTGSAGYIYNVAANTLTQITDPNFPARTVPGWVYLDETLYIMDIFGQIWGTDDLNNPAVWSATNVINASSNSDIGIYLAKQLSYVIALKQWSTQIFYDADNATGSPLSEVPDAQLPYGCSSAGSVQEIDNTLLWMTSNQTVSSQIVRMDNLSARIVSTPDVERILNGISFNPNLPYGGITSCTFKRAGHRWYGLTIVNLNITLVYDLDQPPPYKWYIWTDASGNFWPVATVSYVPSTTASGVNIAQHPTDGYVFPVDADYVYPTDAGSPFPVDIYTANLDFGVNREKYLSKMYLVGDQVTGSTLQTQFSDDDYQTWSTYQNVDLGQNRPTLNDQGSFWRRAYHFRHNVATPFRMRAADLQMDLGVL